jgi:Zn-dependent peptidase ImmA (M78 family)
MLSPIEVLTIRKLGDIGEKLLTKGDYKSSMKVLKEFLAKEVNLFLQEQGMFYPPFDPFKVKQVGGVPIRVEFTPSIAVEGLVGTDQEGFLIRLNDKLSNRRLRSTLAHELIHILFFYDTSKLPPTRLGCAVRDRRFATMEEELCDFLMREFLMPRFSLLDLMSRDDSIKQASMHSISRLKDLYAVSSDIVAWRLIKDLQKWEAVYAKVVVTDRAFKLTTRLKSKSSDIFKHLKLPRYISPSSDEWLNTIVRLVNEAASQPQITKRYSVKEVPKGGARLKIESLLESKKPLTLSILATLT